MQDDPPADLFVAGPNLMVFLTAAAVVDLEMGTTPTVLTALNPLVTHQTSSR